MKPFLMTAPILKFPQIGEPFITVHVDASLRGMGAILTQNQETELAIIANFSKRFGNNQQGYSVTA